MLEQEIKLYSSEQDLHRIIPEVSADAVTNHLQAIYFDTADHQLAKMQAAIRVRSENGEWVQTFKAMAPDGFSNIELNHPVSGPDLNLDLYQDHESNQILSNLTEPLQAMYRTDIRRLVSLQPYGDSTIEIAIDRGVISAGNLQVPVSEVELELKSGNLADLLALSKEWIGKYSLKLDFRNKAQRGSRLSENSLQQAGQAVSDSAPGDKQYFTLPSGIEEFLRRHNGQAEVSPDPALTDTGEVDLFKPLRELSAMAQLQLLCNDLSALTELQDAKVTSVDTEYRLYLILKLALILCQTMHTSLENGPDYLLALLLALHDSHGAGIADDSIEKSIDKLWVPQSNNTALVSHMSAALTNPALQSDLLNKLEYLLTAAQTR